MDAEIIVIGGGLCGLLAATQAARAGARVILLESAAQFGGRARTRAIDGFRFNQGAHALYRAGPLEQALQALGIPISGAKPAVQSARILHQGRLDKAPFDLPSLLRTGFLDNADKLDAMAAMIKLTGSKFSAHEGETASAMFARMARRPGVRALLRALMRVSTYCHAPDLADGAAVLAQMRLATDPGVIYLDHGWGQMIDALIAAARAAGVDMQANQAPSAISRGEGFGVELADGKTLIAAAIVLAVGPQVAQQLCARLAGVEVMAQATLPVHAACLDIGLERLPRPDMPFVLGIDQPVYFAVHSVAKGLAPPGGAVVQMLRYLAPGESPGKAALEAELEAVMDLAQPGWRPLERARQALFMMPVANDLPRAAAGGMSGRTKVAQPGCPGLFLAGDWVGQEMWLSDAAAASAAVAAKSAAAYLRASAGG